MIKPFNSTFIKYIGRSLRAGVLGIAMLSCMLMYATRQSSPAFADEINDESVIRAIIGEASNQGYEGMLAVACAIRNRGSLKGVYGINAKHVDKEPDWVWSLARKAWNESAYKDVTNGATHWENVKAFGSPWWSNNMDRVYEYKDHMFYKERN